MSEERDRFGDLLAKKKKGEEDNYAAEQDRLKLEKLKEQTRLAAASRGRCPTCGELLVVETRDGIEVSACAKRHGVWVETQALETMLGRAAESELSRFFRGFLR